MAPEQGRNNEEITRWRDEGLIEILKILKKIGNEKKVFLSFKIYKEVL